MNNQTSTPVLTASQITAILDDWGYTTSYNEEADAVTVSLPLGPLSFHELKSALDNNLEYSRFTRIDIKTAVIK